MRSWLVVILLSVVSSGCTLSSTSRMWNGRVGPRGIPVYIKSHTNVGFNLFIVIPIPFLSATTTESMLDNLTEEIAQENGDRVRVFQSNSDNYWYGWSPLTWIITPVITSVDAEYEPAAEILAKDIAEQEDA